MKTGSKAVAWVCITSTLFAGCYSSVMINPQGDDREKIYSGQIQYVVTNDRKMYEFKRPPTIVKDTIVGLAAIRMDNALLVRRVSIPTSEVAQHGESDSRGITYVVTKAGAKYVFEEPATIVENAVVGKVRFTDDNVPIQGVSIPLSDVAKVCVSEYDSFGTIVFVAVGIPVAVWLGSVILLSVSLSNI